MRIQRVARERHIIFPADQASNAAGRRFDNAQTASIAASPHHAFGVGRQQLSVTIENCSVRTNHDDSIEERRAAELGIDFMEAAHVALDGVIAELQALRDGGVKKSRSGP